MSKSDEALKSLAQPEMKKGYRKSCCVWESYPEYDPAAAPLAGPGPPEMSAEAIDRLSSVTTPSVPIGMAPVSVPNGFYDAHLQLMNFSQETEGIAAVIEAMDDCGVSHAAIMGCSLKKNWSEFETRMSDDVFNDTDILYYYSLTDLYVLDELKKLPPAQAGRFAPTICGFKPTDRSAKRQVEELATGHPEVTWRGIGPMFFRCSEITNMTTGSVPSPGHPAVHMIMGDAELRNLPVIINHNACSESAKPYKTGFEYTQELQETLQKFSGVKVLWMNAGIYVRGQWAGYKKELDALLSENPNLYISFTAQMLKCRKMTDKELIEIAEAHPDNIMLGSSTMGVFGKGKAYKKDWDAMKKWAGSLSKETYKKITFLNGRDFFKPRHRRASNFKGDLGGFQNKLMHQGTNSIIRTRSDKLHDEVEKAIEKDKAPPAEKNRTLKGMVDGVLTGDADNEIKHVTIDIHLHMLDFLHKSSGTSRILKAMDGCGVEKAVLIGMPCCKKWSKDEPEKPLYYQDDNGQCYFYAYSDQMVADAWMALDDDKRKRFAPVMGSFNPTDINALGHVERMWQKYPGLWRGLGEIMCRHDDLTSLLQDDETPVMNHMAMRPIYEFCINMDTNCMVHHNADRVAEAEDDGEFEYLWEVKQVLEAFPDLKLSWAHAGASRRSSEESHPDMLDKMVSQFPNLHIDMSWVVWEEVVLDPQTGKIKKTFVDLFEKHPTRFSIGSDQVGQFINPAGGNLLKPEIVKYWAIAEQCSAETTKAILYDNAQRVWFDGWDVPLSTKGGRWRKIPPCMKVETLYHNQGYFETTDEMY